MVSKALISYAHQSVQHSFQQNVEYLVCIVLKLSFIQHNTDYTVNTVYHLCSLECLASALCTKRLYQNISKYKCNTMWWCLMKNSIALCPDNLCCSIKLFFSVPWNSSDTFSLNFTFGKTLFWSRHLLAKNHY